ncbi:MAG TPA: MFS transporter [Acidobacteriaceae bacterium]|nr:MFS transporter [Acidobacteriaceae bacterium]
MKPQKDISSDIPPDISTGIRPETPPALAMGQQGLEPSENSGFEPLRIPLFRDRFIAATVSNVGSWMQDTAGTWLMTALTTSPLLIALMQTAASLPVVVLGLLAGATADIIDRRRLLIFWQAWMLTAVAVLSVLTFSGIIGPWWLLSLTFMLNIGTAMNNPAWQAIVPELVPREMLTDAITLNSVSNNVARALGPALGGLMVGAFVLAYRGAGSVFLLNSLSFVGVIFVLYRWKRIPLFKSALPAERLVGSMRSGLRYIRHAPVLRASLMRAFLFTFFVSAVWALLAVVAKRDLHQGAMGYGILNGSLGLGALIGASLLARIRKRASADWMITASTGVFIATLAVMAFVHIPAVVIPSLMCAGFAWTTTMSTLNVSVQLSVPTWVQARALGAYQMTFQLGMASGSVLWGYIAEHASTSKSLACAGAGLLLSLPFALRMHVLRGELPDFSPYVYKRPPPALSWESDPDDGPVRVSVMYKVRVEDYNAFSKAIHKLGSVRLRDGALRWAIFRDVVDPTRLNETFVVESWMDYLRQRERFTASDHAIRDAAWKYHQGPGLPEVSHMIYAHEMNQPKE